MDLLLKPVWTGANTPRAGANEANHPSADHSPAKPDDFFARKGCSQVIKFTRAMLKEVDAVVAGVVDKLKAIETMFLGKQYNSVGLRKKAQIQINKQKQTQDALKDQLQGDSPLKMPGNSKYNGDLKEVYLKKLERK